MNDCVNVDQNSSADCDAQSFELCNVVRARQIITTEIRIMQQARGRKPGLIPDQLLSRFPPPAPMPQAER